jgi:hypothetical protein
MDIRVDVPAGESFVTIKYYKDSMTSAMGDCFKIKPVNEVVTAADLANYVKTTELNAGITTYINSQEGRGKIEDILEGVYVTTNEFGELVSQTDAVANINREISETEAKISLTAGIGKGTIGSKVQAMLTLFSDTDKSTIKLNADAIDLSAYVTIISLKTADATTIDGSNIKTGTISAERINTDSLHVRKIYGEKSTAYENIAVISSSGRNIAIGNGGSTGLSTNLTVWANNISFAFKGAGLLTEYLVINTVDTESAVEGILYNYPCCIYPYNPNGPNSDWSIGNEDFPFESSRLSYGVHMWDSYNEGWATLYVGSGKLKWSDGAGNRYTIS